jgi:hypothetical protein
VPACNRSHFAGISRLPGRGLAAPRAPVAAAVHEVPVRGDRLGERRRSVAEESACRVAHLEEAEVLPVLRRRVQTRLAPGHGDGLSAVPLEDRADRGLRRCLPQDPHVPCVQRLAQPPDLSCRASEPSLGAHKCLPCDNAVLLRPQEPAMGLKEVDDAALSASEAELPVQLRSQREVLRMVPRGAEGLVRGLHFRCRRALCGQEQHAQANDYGLQNVNLLLGDRGAAPDGGRSCLSCAER